MDGQIASADTSGEKESFIWDDLALLKRGSTEYVYEPAVTGGNPILANGKAMFNDMLGNTLGVIGEKDKFTGTQGTSFGNGEKNGFFTGKPYVEGLGYAFLFRNYRPNLGKWQTADPLGYPDGLNNLAYVNNRVTNSFDWLGGKSLSASTSGLTINPLNVLPFSPAAIITTTLTALGVFTNLVYDVNITATGNDGTGVTPTISGESIYLTGTTSGGGGFSVQGIGYSYTYSARILSTSVASTSLVTNADGSKTLTKTYQVYLGADYNYQCFGTWAGTTPIGSVLLSLSHTVNE